MKLTRGQYEIYELLKIYLTYWGAGLLPFMRLSDEMPDSDDTAEMLRCWYGCATAEKVSVQGGDKTPLAQLIVEQSDRLDSVIRKNGGLEVWQRVFSEFKRTCPNDWKVLLDLSRKNRNFKIQNIEDVAERNNIAAGTVLYARERSLRKLAVAIWDNMHFMASDEG